MKKSLQNVPSDPLDKSESENLTTRKEIEHDFSAITGSKVYSFSNLLINQVANTQWLGGVTSEKAQENAIASLAAMKGLKPADEIEGMIAAQLLATHQAIMECYRRSMLTDQTFEGRQEGLNQVNKLTRSFGGLLETLNRYRGKNHTEQKVTVEHVHVHSGGQAIVGNVQPKK